MFLAPFALRKKTTQRKTLEKRAQNVLFIVLPLMSQQLREKKILKTYLYSVSQFRISFQKGGLRLGLLWNKIKTMSHSSKTGFLQTVSNGFGLFRNLRLKLAALWWMSIRDTPFKKLTEVSLCQRLSWHLTSVFVATNWRISILSWVG